MIVSDEIRPDPSLYASFLQLVEIDRIEFLRIAAERTPTLVEVREGRVDVDAKPRLESLDTDSLSAVVDVSVRGNAGKKQVFTCEMQIRAVYRITSNKPGISDRQDLAAFFSKTNVLVNVWPYLRHAVSYITTILGVGTVTLGLLKPHRTEPDDERSEQ